MQDRRQGPEAHVSSSFHFAAILLMFQDLSVSESAFLTLCSLEQEGPPPQILDW